MGVGLREAECLHHIVVTQTRTPMSTHFNLKTTLCIAILLALPVARAASMAEADFKAAKIRISSEYKAQKTACGSLAELEYNYTGNPADHNKLVTARAEAAYEVAKEKCDDMAGNAKDVCVKEAKAVDAKAGCLTAAKARFGKT